MSFKFVEDKDDNIRKDGNVIVIREGSGNGALSGILETLQGVEVLKKHFKEEKKDDKKNTWSVEDKRLLAMLLFVSWPYVGLCGFLVYSMMCPQCVALIFR